MSSAATCLRGHALAISLRGGQSLVTGQVACRWDKPLAALLNSLTKHLGKRLAAERSPRDAQDVADDDGEDGDDGAAGGRALDEAALRRVAGVLVRLAGRAQYSKVGGIWCCESLCCPCFVPARDYV